MKRKIISILLSVCLTLSITACGGSDAPAATDQTTATEETSSETSSESSDEDSQDLSAIGDIEVDQNLLTVEFTIPADYVEASTQEELDAIAKEKGFKSITLHEDGSATYVMTKAQHKELLSGIAESINTALSEMVGSEDYPNITKIEANDDYTIFTVTTSSTELTFEESFSVLGFYIYGGMYSVFRGVTVDNIRVDFINSETGEIINTANSADLADSE